NNPQEFQEEMPVVVQEEKQVEIEVADEMFKFQRHFNKMWFAGNNSNWPLTQFYIHELEETMEKLEHANVVDEGNNISELVKSMAMPFLKDLKTSVQQKSVKDFKESYMVMVNACNSCHVATSHDFVVIKVPETPVMDNQVY